ncbi:MAG: septum formation inhibitor Maf [Xanthomonadaceae bacterium]|nr:septum formation inhibitor Maf [Xanthomonadaceae bacterium]MDE1885556.1 septum formation inhibitor Maf [Xanthomonadaceae bacterium]MDE2083263.1 septum formation inhibitor Maf [Xanthomonadaceae bacterium]MDE2257146.1 septum formation inhibitor Maf [Xanthomonadaceae bacterium]
MDPAAHGHGNDAGTRRRATRTGSIRRHLAGTARPARHNFHGPATRTGRGAQREAARNAVTRLVDVDLVLASTSRYRRELLARVTPNFRRVAPDIDEGPLAEESPPDLAQRLAREKARVVAAKNPGAIVIGSDQTADLDGRLLGKPYTVENACAQLADCSARRVVFHTGLCVIDARQVPHRVLTAHDTTRVHFRELDADTIARYVEREQPLDCAGSFKCEGLGIALFERIESEDPTALIGLPLIALCKLLREAEIEIV